MIASLAIMQALKRACMSKIIYTPQAGQKLPNAKMSLKREEAENAFQI